MNGLRPGDGRQKAPSLMFFQSANGPLASRHPGGVDGSRVRAHGSFASLDGGLVYPRKQVSGNPPLSRDGRANSVENSSAPAQAATPSAASLGDGSRGSFLADLNPQHDIPSHSDSADDVSEVSFGDSSNDVLLPDSSAAVLASQASASSALDDDLVVEGNVGSGDDEPSLINSNSPASEPTLSTRDTQGDATASLLSVHVTECSDSVNSGSPSQLDLFEPSQSKPVSVGDVDSHHSAFHEPTVTDEDEQPHASPPQPIANPGHDRPASMSFSLPFLSDSGEDASLPRSHQRRRSKRQSSEVDMSLSPDSDMLSVPEPPPPSTLNVRPISPPKLVAAASPHHDDVVDEPPQPAPLSPVEAAAPSVEPDLRSVESGNGLSLPHSRTPFSVRSLQPMKCSVSLSSLMAGVGRATAPSAPSPGTISVATARHTETSDPRQLVRTPVPYKRASKVNAGQMSDFVWPEPVSTSATVSPSPLVGHRVKSPNARSTSGISTFTGVQSVRNLPAGLRRAKSVGRAPGRAPVGASPLKDPSASVLVHGQPNFELLQRLKDCLAVKSTQPAAMGKSTSGAPAKRRRSTSPLKKRKPKVPPIKVTVVNVSLPAENVSLPPLSSPIKSPLTMAPPSLPSPWAVVESGDLRQQLVKAARNQPVPVTAYDNLPEKEVEHPPFKALPYRQTGPDPTAMFPHAPELPDAGLPLRDAEYRHHLILTGNPNLLPPGDSVRAREMQQKIVAGQGVKPLSYNSVWEDVVQFGIRENTYPAAWSGYHSYSDEDHGDFASTHPTVSSTQRVPSFSVDLIRQQRRTSGDNQSISDHASVAGRPFPERFLFDGDLKATEDRVDSPQQDGVAFASSHLDLSLNVPDSDDLQGEYKQDDHSTIGPVLPPALLQRDSSYDSSSDNQQSVMTKQTKLTDSFFDVGKRPSRTTRRRHRRRRGNGESASVVSSRSRRSGRSVDSLADVALAAMKNSKGFVASMKDKIEEVERKHSNTWQKVLTAAAKEIRRDRGEKIELSDEEQQALEAERRKGRRHSVFETIPTPSSEAAPNSGSKRPPRPLGDRSFLNTSKTNSSLDISQGIASPPRPVSHTGASTGSVGREPDYRVDADGGDLSGSDHQTGHATPLLTQKSNAKLRKPLSTDDRAGMDAEAGSVHTIDEQHSDFMSEVSMESRQPQQPPPSKCNCGAWWRTLFRRR